MHTLRARCGRELYRASGRLTLTQFPHHLAAIATPTRTQTVATPTTSALPSTTPITCSFTSSTTTLAASSSSEDSDGRSSAPETENVQGQDETTTNSESASEMEDDGKSWRRAPGPDASDPTAVSVKAASKKILDVDPYPPEKLAELEKRYGWVDWNAMAHHLHMADVHFFDQEVPYVDQDFTIKPDFRLLQRLEGSNRLKRLQEIEDKKIHRLLHFGYWVTQGRNVRVASEGKIQSVWTMVVGGDMNGTASYGFGKGEDMNIAQKRALQDLRRNMLFVPLFESRTISHEIVGRHGVCQVRMWPRPRERGMTAGMIPRMIFECFGIDDITAKVDGRALPHHQAMAIFNGLREVKSLREEAIRRGVTAHRMFERGLQQPRHPGRAELIRRGEEVASMLREVKAVQTHENTLNDLGILEAVGKKPTFFAHPEWMEAGDDADPANTFVPSYIVRKPAPVDVGPHTPAPPHPTSRKPAIKETLLKFRGLPHPRTPQTEKTERVY